MSHLQSFRHLYPGCVDDFGNVFAASDCSAVFSALIGYTRTKAVVLNLARILKTVLQTAFALSILMVVANDVAAKSLFQSVQDTTNVPWHIVADEISYDDTANLYIATGNVTIDKMDKHLSADYVRFDQKTMKVFAKGHAIMTVGENILAGDRMEMNLDTETGAVYNGTIFLEESHFYIRGNKIQKVGAETYTADKASLSTCEGDQPAWRITGRNLKITVEGYGFVKHAALWAKKIPVLYSPYMVFPVNTKRQSGLLMPQIGYSDRKGEEVVQPIYWAINESSDATFYYHYMGRRGNKWGFEYRYITDEQSQGALMYDFLDDRQVDDGSPDSEKWGYEDDGVLRPNSDRYWFRMKNDQALPHGFFASLDIDFVSDQDYLHEFKDGYTGFDEAEEYYIEEFGRGFDAYDDPVRLNRLNVSKNWRFYSLNADLQWYDDVIKRRQEETDTTLQRMPVITLNGSKQKISTSPFYFDLASEYTYFYSEGGPRNHRLDIHPRFYLPYRFRNYFSIEPSIGLRGTAWNLDKAEYSSSDKNTLYRGLYDVKVDLSSDIYHIFNLNGKSVERIKHTVRSQIIYDYIPEKDQSELPSLDDVDRIEPKNLITYSITNTFTSKSKKKIRAQSTNVTDPSHADESSDPLSYIYRDFCYLKFEQSYDINKEKADDPEPFSPIYAKLELNPGKYFSANADAQWSHYDRNFRSRNISVTLWDLRGDKLFVEHRYQRDTSETVYADIHIKVSDRWTAYGEYERNILDGEEIRSDLGFLYEAQCWSLDTQYIKEGNDHSIKFMIRLFGIGSIG